ncbi:MAG: FAD-dependent oxidoreductase [Fimbriimonadaceae bacterium]|nr:FAD-dependent oxidoreductase [Fimbriimonadaceae bacterium]
MHIAVVGGGVSGLVAARALSRQHRVTLFEAAPKVGGHVATVTVSDGRSEFQVDTGFIVFNRRNYPLFSALLDELGVETQPTDMSFGVRCDRSGIEYAGRGPRTLFAQPASVLKPGHWRMLADIRGFFRDGEELAQAPASLTVDAYVQSRGRSREFAERFLQPLGSALWSCPGSLFGAFPIRFVAGFLQAHGMLQFEDRPQWEVVRGGSQRYVDKLLKGLGVEFRTSSPVHAVRRTQDGVEVVSTRGAERFDELVFACHADQALDALTDPTDSECAALSAFPYQPNDVVLHTDTSVLPRSKAAWASWNYHAGTQPDAPAAVTYHMNLLQSLRSTSTFCVSLNERGIAPEKVLRRFTYHHPVTTVEGMAARERRASMLRHNRISYCGAYWGYGFHEDGVRSALEVAAAFGGKA